MSSSVNHFLHFLFLLLILLPTIATAQNVTLGSSLTAGVDNTSWVSPSGDFAFGFRPIEDTSGFLLAIWFDKIPDKTIVWFADGDLQIPTASKVELTTNGSFILTDPQGKVLWTAGEQVIGAAYASMLDDGNFVLASGRNSSDYLWESFKYPTDTILPKQFINVKRGNFTLSSRVNDTSYSKGKFRLRMHENGYFALYPVGFPSLAENDYEAYVNVTWSPGPNGSRFVFRESGDIYIVSGNENRINLTWNPAYIFLDSGLYYRATLDFDGIFRHYSHRKSLSGSTQSWTIERSIPENICRRLNSRLGSGVCGYNSYCNVTGDGTPTCQCPPGYEFVDPNNRYGGCRPSFLYRDARKKTQVTRRSYLS